jgi:uncharacterized membrane-anchored protein
MIDSIFDSMKTYGLAFCGWMVTFMDVACGVVQKLTIILVFVGLIVRLIHDIPKAMESVRRHRKRKEG